jgi:succinyl-CoA synthetase beta subunit
MNIHEHQAKAGAGRIRRPGSAQRLRRALRSRRSGQGRRDAGRPGLRREEPDPCRRARQGQASPATQQGRRASSSRIADVRTATPRKCWAMTLVTHQTGPRAPGQPPLHRRGQRPSPRELYLSLLVDRRDQRASPSVVASTEGGMDIEEVAHDTPEKIHTFSIDPAAGVWPTTSRATRSAKALGPDRREQAKSDFGLVVTQLCTKRSSPRTWRCSRSTRWSSPRRATWWRSTPSSRSTTTPVPPPRRGGPARP